MDQQYHYRDSEVDISQDFFISKWPDWIRWGLMIPAALIGCVIVAGLFRLFMGNGSEGDSTGRIWADIVQSGMQGFLFVAIAAYTAPKKQLTVAIIFLTVAALLVGGLLTVGLIYQTESGDKLYSLLHSGLVIAGAGIAVYSIKEEID